MIGTNFILDPPWSTIFAKHNQNENRLAIWLPSWSFQLYWTNCVLWLILYKNEFVQSNTLKLRWIMVVIVFLWWRLKTKMAEKVGKKPQSPRIKCKGPNLTIPEFSFEDFKKQHSHASPTSAKPQSARWKNCLCSPTTHVGSFRCRHHRNSGFGLPHGGSVGSNLSNYAELAVDRKSSPLHDSVEAQ